MSYLLHPMSERAWRIFVPRIHVRTPEFPPTKKALDRAFPFARMKAGECFRLRFDENSIQTYRRCREFVARYNRTYYCHFVMLKHEWGYEVARIV